MAANYITVNPLFTSSPGFSFGRSGTTNAGTYLQVDTVPTNKAGRIVPFETSELSNIFVSCENESTFSIEIQKRVANVFTTVYTFNVTSARVATIEITDVPFTLGDEIAVKVGSGSVQNIVVGLLVKGI